MGSKERNLSTRSSSTEVDSFLRKAAVFRAPSRLDQRGRLMFAMDATASREPTWAQARQLQTEMFLQTSALGGLEVQLCYYRGFLEFEYTSWISQSSELLAKMNQVSCAGGMTQIERVLQHAVREKNRGGVDTLVFVGDCMEEGVDRLCHLAGQLGMLGVPIFVFQEAEDPIAEQTFKELAKLSKGVFCRFDANSPKQLRELLGAAAAYAAGGRRALEHYAKRDSAVVRTLTHQLGIRS